MHRTGATTRRVAVKFRSIWAKKCKNLRVPSGLVPHGISWQELHNRPRDRTERLEMEGSIGRKNRHLRRRPYARCCRELGRLADR
jgi:hypothetical protein